MKHTIMALATVATITAALATPSVTKDNENKRKENKASESEVINQVYQVGQDARLSLSNLNGGATITGWNKNTIEVTATKRAVSGDALDEIEVRFDMKDDHLRIEVDYDNDRQWYGPGPSVEFEIRVPHSLVVRRVEMVNGGLEIKDLTGDVSASSVNGDVNGEGLSGETHLSTVNGDVTLSNVEGTDDIELSSVNGSVTLYLPRNVNAKLSASTVHGDIRGELVEGVTHAGSSMDAILGTGGPRIELGTVNGDIRIRRASSDTRDDSDNDSD